MCSSVFSQARADFHAKLLETIILTTKGGVPNFADHSQKFSKDVAQEILSLLGGKHREGRLPGQTLGDRFESQVSSFIETTFPALGHIRPGNWSIEKIGSRSTKAIAKYEQYTLNS